jgi:hypothetical protein
LTTTTRSWTRRPFRNLSQNSGDTLSIALRPH